METAKEIAKQIDDYGLSGEDLADKIIKARAEMRDECAAIVIDMCHEPAEGKLIADTIRAIPNE